MPGDVISRIQIHDLGGYIVTTDQSTYTHQRSPARVRRWPWIVGIVVVFIVGIGIGAVGAGDNTETTATTDNSAEITELQNQIADLEAERDEALDALAAQAGEEPAEEPEPETLDEPAEIGDTVAVEWGSGDTGHITVTDVKSTTKPYDQYGSGPKHDRFVIFTVDLEAQADQFDVYEDDFYVVIDGTRYDHGEGNAYDAADYDDQLGYAELNAGEKKSGLLVFDLPEGSGELFYAPNFEGGAIASWKF
jgi:hypothetical protein